MGRLRRSRTHRGIRDISRKYRTRRRTKDLDQIHEDLKTENTEKLLASQKGDTELPGLGEHFCIQCSRHFISGSALSEHYRGKLHKKRVKLLKEEPYNQKEAEAAAGLTTDNGKRTEKEVKDVNIA